MTATGFAPAPPQRLLVVLTSLCAEGTPVLTLDLCRRWKQWGIEPTVVTLAEEPRDLAAEFEAAGVAVRTLGLTQSGPARFTQMASALYRLARELRPNAMLSMPFGWHAFLAMGARWAGVRRVGAHVGNYPPHWLNGAFTKFRFLVQLGRPVTDTLFCCSRYVQEGVVEHFGVPRAETEVVYNGSNVAAVRARAAKSRRAHGVFRVGMVARLEVHKDQPTLIRAAKRLQQRGVPLEVWLIGEGSRRAEYERLIRELELQQHVQLLGMRRDIPELLGELDAFVFSAKPDEGLGVALIEAMAAEVPIIASDVGACREVLDGGALASMVPPADPEALAEAIVRLRDEPDAARARAQRAARKAGEVFSMEAMARAYAHHLGLRVP